MLEIAVLEIASGTEYPDHAGWSCRISGAHRGHEGDLSGGQANWVEAQGFWSTAISSEARAALPATGYLPTLQGTLDSEMGSGNDDWGGGNPEVDFPGTTFVS
jgi:hypothetical protein